jgi:DNA processing protein
VSDTPEKIAALRLINTPKIGARTFYRLVEEYGSIAQALIQVEQSGKYKPWSAEQAQKELEEAHALGIEILLYTDDDYPAQLKPYDMAPPVLYVKGNLEALDFNQAVAIVGSRAASVNGRKIAAHIAKELTESGVCVISGMARGIDAAAHKGALYACDQTGATIAVLGTGLDVIYPPENEDLYRQIAVNGCVISEMPLHTKAAANLFPRRNRIVTALSDGVLVVEAGLQSGSLITADFALEQNKLLFAVPGTPGESRAQGSNKLIKEGARLVENAADILPFLKGKAPQPIQHKRTPRQKVLVFENNNVKLSEQDNQPRHLVDYLTIDGVDIDELIRLTGIDAARMAMEILELEMSGIAERRAGNKIALTKSN